MANIDSRRFAIVDSDDFNPIEARAGKSSIYPSVHPSSKQPNPLP